MTGLTDYWHLYQANGLQRVVDEIRENALYDWRYGVDTQTYLPIADYPFEHQSKSHAIRYEPTYTSTIRMALAAVDEIKSSDVSFVDLGSGKGKVILEALNHHYTQVYGVEFNDDLNRIAEANIEHRYHGLLRATLIHEDAKSFIFPSDCGVVFCFNPFGPEVLTSVLNHYQQHAKSTQRRVFFVYVNPVHAELFSEWQVVSTLSNRQRVDIYAFDAV